jgi:hypothetical protein
LNLAQSASDTGIGDSPLKVPSGNQHVVCCYRPCYQATTAKNCIPYGYLEKLAWGLSGMARDVIRLTPTPFPRKRSYELLDQFSLYFCNLSLLPWLGRGCCRFIRCFRFLLPLVLLLLLLWDCCSSCCLLFAAMGKPCPFVTPLPSPRRTSCTLCQLTWKPQLVQS